jgi:hypothetical protein
MISQEHELDSGLVQIETEKQAKGVRRDEMMMPPFFSVCAEFARCGGNQESRISEYITYRKVS